MKKIIIFALSALAMIIFLMISGCVKTDPPAPSYPSPPGMHKDPLAGRDSTNAI